MPDCHYGKGATVGTVLATDGAVIPAAVGVDIGCGMIAVRTPLKRSDITSPATVRAGIERRIRVADLAFRLAASATRSALSDRECQGPREIKFARKQFVNVKGD